MEIIICEVLDVAAIYQSKDDTWITPDGKYTIWCGWVGCGKASEAIAKTEENLVQRFSLKKIKKLLANFKKSLIIISSRKYEINK